MPKPCFRHVLPLVLMTLSLGAGCTFRPIDDEGTSQAASRAAEVALDMVGTPYHYGGNTPSGFDCSGLVQYSYNRAGIRLPHSTDKLRRYSHRVSLRGLERGDLLFFDEAGAKSSHVGIYIGHDEFVHAPSTGKKVHTSNLSDRYWRNHFAEARRVNAD